jgi:hypothetical protein
MDEISIWLHNSNVDRTLDRLCTYVEPSTAAELLKFLVEQEDLLGTGPEQLENTARRVREGRERITRILNIVEGLAEHDLLDQEQVSRALSVVTAMREAQRLVEQRYEMMGTSSSHEEE